MSTLQATSSTSMKLSASSTPAVMNNTNSSSNPHVLIVVNNPTTVGTGSVLQCNSSILNLCNSNDNNKEQGTTLNKKKHQVVDVVKTLWLIPCQNHHHNLGSHPPHQSHKTKSLIILYQHLNLLKVVQE
mmetsp:Transcript_14335/g.26907  ORF Transcript_14335/g.26907 Transcript_14335/m.26907 type:complete len:129 (+) Transcript_14335:139-525(+)